MLNNKLQSRKNNEQENTPVLYVHCIQIGSYCPNQLIKCGIHMSLGINRASGATIRIRMEYQKDLCHSIPFSWKRDQLRLFNWIEKTR